MGPKKAAAAKKKGGDGGGEAGGELTPEEKAKMFMLTCQALQVQLGERSEEASKALAAKREYQGRITQIEKDFQEEQRMTFEITQDMTRQYKGMQEDLLTRINKLEQTILDLNDRIAESDIRQERIMKDKNEVIRMKDEEIARLNMKMDDMAEEFGEMLRETLEKMRERIEISSNNYDGSDVMIQQRMEELKHND